MRKNILEFIDHCLSILVISIACIIIFSCFILATLIGILFCWSKNIRELIRKGSDRLYYNTMKMFDDEYEEDEDL